MQDPDFGLSDELLNSADVVVYFSHKHWREIPDERVDALQRRVLEGMGLVLLHSSHASKIFSRLMGTRTQILRWRENDEWQRVWLVAPAHPIAAGLNGEFFVIPQDETYGEYFEIPQPDEQVFLTTAQGGEVLRSGCCWYRGQGRVFYFSAGHETYPVYYQPEVRRILLNAVRWACPPPAAPAGRIGPERPNRWMQRRFPEGFGWQEALPVKSPAALSCRISLYRTSTQFLGPLHGPVPAVQGQIPVLRVHLGQEGQVRLHHGGGLLLAGVQADADARQQGRAQRRGFQYRGAHHGHAQNIRLELHHESCWRWRRRPRSSDRACRRPGRPPWRCSRSWLW